MNKKDIEVVEEKIKRYVENEEKIKLNKNIIVALKERKENINEKIKDLNFKIKTDISGVNLEYIKTNSGDKSSYFEKDLLSKIEREEKLIEEIEERILNLEHEINFLEIENEPIRSILNLLQDEYKELFEYKYLQKLSEIDISNKLNVSIPYYHKKKVKLFQIIYNLMFMLKKI